jgi:phospholipase/carboxylesterase
VDWRWTVCAFRNEAMPFHHYELIAGAETFHTPLLMLHGSGRTEQDMVPLAAELSPKSMAVAVRGAVPWESGFAFFRRFEDRSIDENSIAVQVRVLAGRIEKISADHRFVRPPIAVGFSNGAIMAAALMMLYPHLLSGAVLFRPLSPFAADPRTSIPGTPVLITDGRDDHRRSPGDAALLASRLARLGASVTHHQLPVGHSITEHDRRLAHEWLQPLLCLRRTRIDRLINEPDYARWFRRACAGS